MSELTDFFQKEVGKAMLSVRLEHFLIRDFLSKILASYVTKSDVFCVKREPMVAFAWEKNPSELEGISKKLLFTVGIFPDSLKAIGKRQVSVGYYIGIENILVRKLATSGPRQAIWTEINKNFKSTIKVLIAFRGRINLPELDIVTTAELISYLKDPLIF